MKALLLGLTMAVWLLVQGCSTPQRLAAVPSELTARAEIPGMPNVRFALGGDITELSRKAQASPQLDSAQSMTPR